MENLQVFFSFHFFLGIVLSLPVVILSMFFMDRFVGENILLLVLTTPIWAIVGWEFHRGAINTLRHDSANMDTLVSLGSTASYLLSVIATFFPHLVGGVTFYDTTALIVTLIFLGKYLEARAKGQTNDAIKKLMGLQARTAHVIRNGSEVERLTTLEAHGKTAMLIALDGKLAGAVAVADTIKSGSQEAIKKLHAQGLAASGQLRPLRIKTK